MRWFLTGLCVIQLAASPAAARADTGSETVSAKPIVIAYVPEHLQQRVPGHQSAPSTQPPQQSELEVARLRVKHTRAGLIAMGALTAAGGLMIGAGLAAAARRPREPSGSLSSISFHPGEIAAFVGGIFAVAGGVGMVIAGPMLGARKRQLRKVEQAERSAVRLRLMDQLQP